MRPGNNVYIVIVTPDITKDQEQLSQAIAELEKNVTTKEAAYKAKVVEIGRSIKWPNVTAKELGQLNTLVEQIAPLFLKKELSAEESQRKTKYAQTTIKILIPLYNSLQELKIDLAEKKALLKQTEKIPKNVAESIRIQLDHIQTEDILHILGYTLPINEDFRTQWEEQQQSFTQHIRNLTGKKYPIQWTHFLLQWEY